MFCILLSLIEWLASVVIHKEPLKSEELENKIDVPEVEESGQSITSNTVVKQQEVITCQLNHSKVITRVLLSHYIY